MCKAFLPLLSNTGRIVNLSSVASSLKPYSEAIQARIRDPNATLTDLEQLAQEFEVRIIIIISERPDTSSPSCVIIIP